MGVRVNVKMFGPPRTASFGEGGVGQMRPAREDGVNVSALGKMFGPATTFWHVDRPQPPTTSRPTNHPTDLVGR